MDCVGGWCRRGWKGGDGDEGRIGRSMEEEGGRRRCGDLGWRRDVKGGSVESEGGAGQDQDGV